jgi:hypothetical protein
MLSQFLWAEFTKGWRTGVLFFELFLFALSLILPQLDFPDFTFTAPNATTPGLSPPSAFFVVFDPVHARSLEHIAENKKSGNSTRGPPESVFSSHHNVHSRLLVRPRPNCITDS